MTTLRQLAQGQSSPEAIINGNLQAISYMAIFGNRYAETTGLTWAYYGGLYNSTTVADGTLALADNASNHVVAHRSTGVVSSDTATTQWNNTATYARLYLVTTAGGAITAAADHRFGASGLIAPPGSVAATAVPIDDAGNHYAATNVEGALQEVAADVEAGAADTASILSALAYVPLHVFLEGKPNAAQVLFDADVVGIAFSLPINASGSTANAAIAATAQADYVLKKGATVVATIRFAAAATTATFIAASATAWAPGDRLTLVAPNSVDTTLSDVRINLRFDRSI